MGKLDGKVAFISGAARGQGRAHAVRLAEEGADIIAIDVCGQYPTVVYQMSTPEDLRETVRQVESLGRRIVAREADVTDFPALQKAFDDGAAELGGVDIVVANAGIGPGGQSTDDEQWDDVVNVNMKGVWNTVRVAVPTMLTQDRGGSIILTSSTGGLIGTPVISGGMLGYTAAKHGVIGIMRTYANYLAPHYIRVNGVAPTTVATPMANNGDLSMLKKYEPAIARSLENAIPVDYVEAHDVANAVAWLASDDARYVTGTVVPVDAGLLNKV
ncbi:SDR family mycofactocin-dependent oxidoreductase [Mycolicibacterium sp. BK556]|uniref:mycofactocin-coupled SDR family oxidoreductase n=1 Tax=unclassified Mycolicibacterium TaxID=2636767 RepID=UPI001614BAA8|nr:MULTISPECIES: mycofactocin-coupled SDR family oxidoreductase [unclassified Mycolicibacterium]MBB3605515.1 SDR family mycofactocin-dependent oxidoreductase [Mycolicibacterium sp. BK556]MBB3635988.1 SDR family mycofactocin-dependent oxidoreductase [Mycolicibacterium sp. BK607]